MCFYLIVSAPSLVKLSLPCAVLFLLYHVVKVVHVDFVIVPCEVHGRFPDLNNYMSHRVAFADESSKTPP